MIWDNISMEHCFLSLSPFTERAVLRHDWVIYPQDRRLTFFLPQVEDHSVFLWTSSDWWLLCYRAALSVTFDWVHVSPLLGVRKPVPFPCSHTCSWAGVWNCLRFQPPSGLEWNLSLVSFAEIITCCNMLNMAYNVVDEQWPCFLNMSCLSRAECQRVRLTGLSSMENGVRGTAMERTLVFSD